MDLRVSKAKEKVKKQDKVLEQLKQVFNTSPVMQDEEVKQYLKDFKQNFVLAPFIKYMITFFKFVKNYIVLSCQMKLSELKEEVTLHK